MALVAALTETAMQYQTSMLTLKQRLENIRSSHSKSLTTALWFFDEDQLKQQMRGILRDPNIIFIEVKSPSVTISLGEVGNREHLMSRSYELLFMSEESKSQEKMGELYFIVRIDNIIRELFAKAWFTLLVETGKTLLISLFIFMVFRLLISRHLGTMAEYTRSLTIDNLSEQLKLRRSRILEGSSDELSSVVSAVNEMRTTLQNEIEENRNAAEALVAQTQLLNNVMSNIPCAIYWKDQQLDYLGCNENFLKETNLEKTESIVGRNEHILTWQPKEKEAFYERDKQILNTGQAALLKEDTIHTNKEVELTVLSSTVPMTNAANEIEGVLGIFTDVTDIKKVEQKLKELNESLESKIQRRTQQLQQANMESKSALDKLTSAQNQLVESEKMAAIGSLVAGVAHEINTPLGISVTAASHMQNQARNLQELFDNGKMTRKDFSYFFDTCCESIDILIKNLHRSQDLISSFKQVAADQSSGENRTFDLAEYLREVILSLKPKLKVTSHTVDVQVPDGIELFSNPGALSHVMTNLIMNSLIHGFEDKENGTISISAEKIQEGQVKLIYSDNGKGIPEEHLKTIYEPFFTTKRGSGGSGLGLHILYTKVTNALKGQVKCHSELDVGTTFEFIIPEKI